MDAPERIAFLLGDEPGQVERFVAPLRRANMSVRRTLLAAEAERFARQSAVDLVVVVLPAAGAAELLRSIRSADSPSRRAGVVVVAEGDGSEPSAAALGALANTILPADGSLDEFQRAAAALLDVAPRAAAPAGSQIQVRMHDGTQLDLRVQNLSASGVLMRTPRPLAVGTTFGFALDLPGESEPIRGRARVVRDASENGNGERLTGARFLALGGEGPARLQDLVARARVASGAGKLPPARSGTAAGAAARPQSTESASELAAGEAARCREELAELTPLLDEMLERGLTRRLVVADWYVTGAGLGLESLGSFSAILASIYEDRVISAAAARRLADLREVRQQLTEFGRPIQDVATRVKILLSLRPALERLLRELAETAASSGTGLAGFRFPGIVSQVVVDIKRLVGAYRSLQRLEDALVELQRPRLLFGRKGARYSAEQIRKEFAPLAASFGVSLGPSQLRGRRQLRDVARATAQARRDLHRRLTAVHGRIFSLRFRALATDDLEADLENPKLHQVLVDSLASGAEYLARAYSAYRHALEAIGGEPALIDRAERLGAVVLQARRTAEVPSTMVPAEQS